MQALSTKQKGDWGEKIAHDYLVAQGYAIREVQWKKGPFEIDLVVQKDDQVIFVEVKTRLHEGVDPVLAVNKRKRQHMIASANTYMQSMEITLEYRFDILAIVGDESGYKIEHIPDAFFPSLKRYSFSFRL